MGSDSINRFFDEQFARQVREGDFRLNPFEAEALPLLSGRILDYGCGLGNLSIAAARRGCTVVALDASRVAIEHIRDVARRDGLPIDVEAADLRTYDLREDFDGVVSIGLLMFLDCPTAFERLEHLKAHVRRGGLAFVNVLIEGTTYLDMFDRAGHCLFSRDEMARRFAGWDVLSTEFDDYPAPRETVKSFVTLAARRP